MVKVPILYKLAATFPLKSHVGSEPLSNIWFLSRFDIPNGIAIGSGVQLVLQGSWS